MDEGIVEQLRQVVDESQYYNSGIPYNLMDVVHMLIAERDTLTPPAATPPTRADIEPILIKGAAALIAKGTVDEDHAMQMLGGALWLWREGEGA